MATATVAKNPQKVMLQVEGLLRVTSSGSASKSHNGTSRRKNQDRLWVCAGAPTSTAPTGMAAGDLILDTTNSAVYRYISSTTYARVDGTS